MSVCCAINYVFIWSFISKSLMVGTTDDIFAIAIAIVIVIQWNSLLRFTGNSGRKIRIAKEVTDVRDKKFFATTIFNNVTIWLWIEISMSNANDIHMHTKFLNHKVKVVEIFFSIKISLKWITKQIRIDSASANANATNGLWMEAF